MGIFAEDTARALPVHARGAGRVRHRVAETRQAGAATTAPSQDEIVPVTVEGRKGGERRSSNDEQPRKAEPDEDPDAQARLRQGRHGDGGEFLARSPTARPRWC